MTLEDKAREIAGRFPVGFRHAIVEPDGKETWIFSSSADNPWSHWVQSHRDQCKYSVVALYSEDALRTVRNGALEEAAIVAEGFDASRITLGEYANPAAQEFYSAGIDDGADGIATAIRSLKESP